MGFFLARVVRVVRLLLWISLRCGSETELIFIPVVSCAMISRCVWWGWWECRGMEVAFELITRLRS